MTEKLQVNHVAIHEVRHLHNGIFHAISKLNWQTVTQVNGRVTSYEEFSHNVTLKVQIV